MINYNLDSSTDPQNRLTKKNTSTDDFNDEIYVKEKSWSDELNDKKIHSDPEIGNTFNEDLDKANKFESIEDLKNLRWKENYEYIVPIQRWYGVVKEVSEDNFTADLDDLTEGGTKESAEFDKIEVEMSERALIEPGAIFYYYIAYMLKNGTKFKLQILRFKRPTEWRAEDFEKAMAKADSMYEYFLSKRK